MQSQMMGRGMPMDVNEWVIRPLLMNVSVIGLFLIPMITMRLFAEEKRSGTIELLATSPVRDIEDHHRQMARRAGAVRLRARHLGAERRVAVPLRQARSCADSHRLSRVCCCRAAACWRSAHSSRRRHSNQIIAAFATFAVCLLLWVLDWVSAYETAAWAKVVGYMSVITHFEPFSKGRDRHQRRDLLSVDDLLRAVSDRTIDGIAAVEGIDGYEAG